MIRTFFIYMLLLPEGQMGEDWDLSKKSSALWETGAVR
jgi:hypothetical protein